MAKTPAEVDAFLKDLEEKLRPLGIKERDDLLALKKEEHERLGLTQDPVFRLWDYRRVFSSSSLFPPF
jgi:Zn-dependent oligopeptidase